MKNQRKFLDWMFQELSMKDQNDWYKVTQKDFISHGATALLGKYNNSPSLVLSSVYPEKEWYNWKFAVAPRDTWEDDGSQRKFFDWAANELGLKDLSGWYSVKRRVILQGGEKLRNRILLNWEVLVFWRNLIYPCHKCCLKYIQNLIGNRLNL